VRPLRLACRLRQLAFELADPRLQQPDFLDEQVHRAADELRDRRFPIGKHPADLLQPEASALRNADAELSAESPQRVDPRGARGHPQRSGAVQGLHGLLLDRFHAHRDDVGATRRFQ
jgi:hypothetical protein